MKRRAEKGCSRAISFCNEEISEDVHSPVLLVILLYVWVMTNLINDNETELEPVRGKGKKERRKEDRKTYLEDHYGRKHRCTSLRMFSRLSSGPSFYKALGLIRVQQSG